MKKLFFACCFLLSLAGYAQPGNGCDPGAGGCTGRAWFITDDSNSIVSGSTYTYTLTHNFSCAPNNAPVITIKNTGTGSFRIHLFNGATVNTTLSGGQSTTFSPNAVDYCHYSQGPDIVYTVVYDTKSGSVGVSNTLTSVTSPNTLGFPTGKNQTWP